MKHARRKLTIPMPAAMPCKTPVNCRGETCRSVGKHKTKYACIVDADESMRIRLEDVPHWYHEDHTAGQGDNSLQHCNLVHKFIPMPQAMKIPDAKDAVDKEWEKLENTFDDNLIPLWFFVVFCWWTINSHVVRTRGNQLFNHIWGKTRESNCLM